MSANPKKKTEVLRIWVPKSAMKAAWSKLSEDQQSVISANICKSMPDDYEIFPDDRVKAALLLAGIEWRDTKIKPKVPIAAPQES